MKRSAALLLVLATALAGTVAIVYGTGDGAVVWLGLVALGAVVLGLAHALAGRRPRLGSLHRQFTIGVALAVGQLVVLAAAAAQLMFVSAHDALLLMVIVCSRAWSRSARRSCSRPTRCATSRCCGTRSWRWGRGRARPPPSTGARTRSRSSRARPTRRSSSSTARSAPAAT